MEEVIALCVGFDAEGVTFGIWTQRPEPGD